jgi:hypothetical protein
MPLGLEAPECRWVSHAWNNGGRLILWETLTIDRDKALPNKLGRGFAEIYMNDWRPSPAVSFSSISEVWIFSAKNKTLFHVFMYSLGPIPWR